MNRLFASLYWKLSFVFLFLLNTVAAIFFMVLLVGRDQLDQEVEQRLSLSIVDTLHREVQPLLSPAIQYSDYLHYMERFRRINPHLTVLILSDQGDIYSDLMFGAALPSERSPRVAVGPIEEFFSRSDGANFPIKGENPIERGEASSVFSARKIQIAQKPGYLYILPHSSLRGSFFKGVGALRSAQNLLMVFGLTAVGSGILGLVLFYILTRKFYRMVEVVTQYRSGDLSQRVKLSGNDEISQLGQTIDQMADTIATNIAELKQKDELRRELVSAISHDLRGPLMSIQGYAETLEQGPEDPAVENRCLHGILGNTRFLDKLIRQLFELSKLEARQIQPKRAPFFMGGLLEDTERTFLPLAKDRSVNICLLNHYAVPPVVGDSELILRALFNLVDNAIRYSPPDGQVTLSCEASDEGVTVEVRDQGCGVPADKLPFIFDRLYRVDADRSKLTGGAGLGLAIVREIILAHGSSIEVASSDEGTRFYFTLPIAPAEAHPPELDFEPPEDIEPMV